MILLRLIIIFSKKKNIINFVNPYHKSVDATIAHNTKRSVNGYP